ncbi:MAG: C-GCAxxG-C-C family protein [Acutalibacteraceae bacterium]
MGDRAERACSFFMEGYTCAQSLFTAFADIFGFDKETALKVSAGLGGGVGRMREVCGVVTSASMILGLMYGATDGADRASKAYTYEKVREFAEKFKAIEGTIICRELLGLKKAEESHIPEERTKEYYASRPCPRITREAAEILEKMIEEYFASQDENNIQNK